MALVDAAKKLNGPRPVTSSPLMDLLMRIGGRDQEIHGDAESSSDERDQESVGAYSDY